MKKVWFFVNGFKLKKEIKSRLFVLIMIILSMLAGGGIWGLAARFWLPEITWLICFMGYPGIFVGFLGSVIYLYNHDFA